MKGFFKYVKTQIIQASAVDKVPFSDLPLSSELQRAVKEVGFELASPIQTKAIPVIAEGHDVVGLAQTGTGKTAAFGLPLLDKIDPTERSIQGLILVPTRELALQVTKELKSFSTYKPRLSLLSVYGGQPIQRQIYSLQRGVHIVIATPGRLLDHLRQKTMTLEDVKIVIMDEADEMLNMGFREDIESILKQAASKHQTLLFSATMSNDIKQLSKSYLKHPWVVEVAPEQRTVAKIQQSAFKVYERDKVELLSRLIDLYQFKKGLIFVNTKKEVDAATKKLLERGYPADNLHGDMQQSRRDSVMKSFRERKSLFLVASDVAARGIDVDDIEVVVNFDVPMDTEDYVHRIGRTGRAGREGKAFTFVSPNQGRNFRDVERFINQKIDYLPLPAASEIKKARLALLATKIKDGLEEGNFKGYLPTVQSMLKQDINLEEVLALFVQMYIEDSTRLHEGDLMEPSLHERSNDRGNDRYSRPYNSRPSYSRGGSSGGDRYERRDRGSSSRSNEDMVPLSFNLGRRHGIEPRDVVGAIAGESGISGSSIGKIRIGDTTSTVDIPRASSAQVLEKMKGKSIKGNLVDLHS